MKKMLMLVIFCFSSFALARPDVDTEDMLNFMLENQERLTVTRDVAPQETLSEILRSAGYSGETFEQVANTELKFSCRNASEGITLLKSCTLSILKSGSNGMLGETSMTYYIILAEKDSSLSISGILENMVFVTKGI